VLLHVRQEGGRKEKGTTLAVKQLMVLSYDWRLLLSLLLLLLLLQMRKERRA